MLHHLLVLAQVLALLLAALGRQPAGAGAAQHALLLPAGGQRVDHDVAAPQRRQLHHGRLGAARARGLRRGVARAWLGRVVRVERLRQRQRLLRQVRQHVAPRLGARLAEGEAVGRAPRRRAAQRGPRRRGRRGAGRDDGAEGFGRHGRGARRREGAPVRRAQEVRALGTVVGRGRGGAGGAGGAEQRGRQRHVPQAGVVGHVVVRVAVVGLDVLGAAPRPI